MTEPKPAFAPTNLAAIGADSADGRYYVVVEVQAGSRNKYKFEPRLGAFVLHRVLPAGLAFPCGFGFVPSTKGEDGDPLDALVFLDEPAPVGTVVDCRLVGVIECEQSHDGRTVRNDRLLAVAAQSPTYRDCRDLGDLDAATIDAIERFFVAYNERRGVRFVPLARRGAAAARAAVEAART
ncbi:MAG TPA: inorganic diphosphatase [Dokdonella sp.]